MSEPIPESIPTSFDKRTSRPLKKRALTPVSAHASALTTLFANPSLEIKLPTSPSTKTVAPPPEIVANVQGSSAGAGSGEFHVYKASRRREYERLRLMEEEVRKEKEDGEWERGKEEARRRDEERTRRNRERREKKKRGRKGKVEEGVEMHVDGREQGDGEVMRRVEGVGGEVGEAREEIGVLIHDDD